MVPNVDYNKRMSLRYTCIIYITGEISITVDYSLSPEPINRENTINQSVFISDKTAYKQTSCYHYTS